ncbi:hypothetical protein [Larsenimonas suaedae]|uniref:Uncharacterized protein n=1 Tax=Larsenimonas suaedae TaxID=1851019 RepID=A0ABU1GZ87_9GAMM|nr:hypothetical protein [Larsenimonas suaedae]MDR5897368.1 hypothetical protein [Larsenimonas suaedae]
MPLGDGIDDVAEGDVVPGLRPLAGQQVAHVSGAGVKGEPVG